jgi:hypothetical protein
MRFKSDKQRKAVMANIVRKNIATGVSPPLKNKGVEAVVWQDFRRGDSWKAKPYTRYFLMKDGKQIDGMDDQNKSYSKKNISLMLKRKRIMPETVKVYVK